MKIKPGTIIFVVGGAVLLTILSVSMFKGWLDDPMEFNIDPQAVDAQFAKAEPVYLRFARALDQNGDGTGSKDATGDYSVTPTTFRICPPLNQVFRITAFHVFYQDQPGWKAEEYGAAPALSIGIKMNLTTAGQTVQGMDFGDGFRFKSNGDWAKLFTHSEFIEMGGGDEFAHNIWMIEETGHELQLTGASQHCLTMSLNDDFSFLTAQAFIAEGYIVGQTY
ncbi:MAG: hypothetical protein V3R83_09940 [Gammaproteobacteria bacterium]